MSMKNINFLATGGFQRQQAARITASYNKPANDPIQKSEDNEINEEPKEEEEEIEKGGGEGSRGGKVIRHTSSGKPIYGAHDDRAKHPLHRDLEKFTSKYTDDPKHWDEGSGELAEVHSKMAEAYNEQQEAAGSKERYTAHEGVTRGSAKDAHTRHKKGIAELAGKLNERGKDRVHDHFSEWFNPTEH